MKKIFSTFLFCVSMATVSKAQDPNFSQFFASPLTLNPALTGKLRKVMPISLETALSGGQEFALIVARRNLDGSLDPIGDAGGDLQLLEHAAKRLLAG